MDTSQSTPVNVDTLELSGERKLYLIGTAHISEKSAELVYETIHRIRPDTVCLELCDGRAQAIQNKKRWEETDIFEIVKSGRSYLLLAQLILASFQKKLAKKLNINPGEEMLRAITAAEEVGAKISNIDRDIRITLRRAWAQAGFITACKVLWALLLSMFSEDEITAEEIEELKQGDVLSVIVAEFSEFLPGIKEVLIDERDKYLSQKIKSSPGRTLVAVVGAGHVPGIKQHIAQDIYLAELEEIPPRSRLSQSIMWGIPAVIIGLICYGFTLAGEDVGEQMVLAWFLWNGCLAALGALLALAHPLTILTAFIAAPFTSLNPMVAAGWVSGLVEVFLRKPQVKDLETLGEDSASLGGFWNNRALRILLVVILTNLGSAAGTILGAAKIVSLL